MSDKKTTDEVQSKLRKLIDRYEKSVKELDEVKTENKTLKGKLKEREEELKGVEKNVELSSFAQALGGSELGAAELRIKLNQYIREIDKVIMKLKAEE